VTAYADDQALVVDVQDDGIGGADPDGHGLRGLRDRVEALAGTLRLASSPEFGTRLHATLPLADPARRDA
jgi:signal transduction histidine kinase